MTSSEETLTEAFATLVENHRFRRSNLTWCRKGPSTLVSFGLQKSKYAERYFINLGVLFLRLEDGTDRSPHKCHFYGRLGDERTLQSLDFGTAFKEDRLGALAMFRDGLLIPVADRCSTEEGSIEFYLSGALRVPLVAPEARHLLGLSK
jgi:hypothetical protein